MTDTSKVQQAIDAVIDAAKSVRANGCINDHLTDAALGCGNVLAVLMMQIDHLAALDHHEQQAEVDAERERRINKWQARAHYELCDEDPSSDALIDEACDLMRSAPTAGERPSHSGSCIHEEAAAVTIADRDAEIAKLKAAGGVAVPDAVRKAIENLLGGYCNMSTKNWPVGLSELSLALHEAKPAPDARLKVLRGAICSEPTPHAVHPHVGVRVPCIKERGRVLELIDRMLAEAPTCKPDLPVDPGPARPMPVETFTEDAPASEGDDELAAAASAFLGWWVSNLGMEALREAAEASPMVKKLRAALLAKRVRSAR